MLLRTYLKSLKEKFSNSKKNSQKTKKKGRKKESKFKKIMKKINLIDSDDIKSIKSIVFDIVFYGLALNFALFVIFGIEFNWYSWIGWGLAVYIADYKVTKFFRKLIVKK